MLVGFEGIAIKGNNKKAVESLHGLLFAGSGGRI